MFKFKSALVVLICSLFAMAPVMVQAQSITALQQSGQVGERPDGLAGIVVASPSPDVVKAVDAVNQQRLAEYQKIAAQTNAPLAAVQARAGAQIIARLPAGSYYMDAAGRWSQK